MQKTGCGADGVPGLSAPGPVEEELRLRPAAVTPLPRPMAGNTAKRIGGVVGGRLVLRGPATTRNVSSRTNNPSRHFSLLTGTDSVNCGSHRADTCAECPVITSLMPDHQEKRELLRKWCKGNCVLRDDRCTLNGQTILNGKTAL